MHFQQVIDGNIYRIFRRIHHHYIEHSLAKVLPEAVLGHLWILFEPIKHRVEVDLVWTIEMLGKGTLICFNNCWIINTRQVNLGNVKLQYVCSHVLLLAESIALLLIYLVL